MSKYDFEIDLGANTSTGMILNQIQEGSCVLEFGCATGRMTRYMKEALGCRVYIVELDRGAYETALQYAEDGVCDDILTFSWAEKFRDVAFDAIIFADVLEHLTAPERALEEAAKLLKDTGKLFVSVPNVTHNDILLKATQEHFDYTATGLLDDTHVHFWGLENLKALDGKWGLHIRKIQGTYCPTGYTEQAPAVNDCILQNILRQRRCGEVYQFVVTMDKTGEQPPETEFRAPSVRSHIYLDLGGGFNAEDIVAFDSVYEGQGIYRSHCVLLANENLQAIRFDPVEFQSCILRSISMSQGQQQLPMHFANGVSLEDGILLPGTDPSVTATVVCSNIPVTVEAEFLLPGEDYVAALDTGAQKLDADRARYQTAVQQLENVCAHRQAVIQDLENVSTQRQAVIEALEGEIKNLRGSVAAMSVQEKHLRKELKTVAEDNAQLRQDVCAYIILANNKEKYALEVERERDACQTRICELEGAVFRYENMKIVKMRAFAARVYKGLKRRAKKLLKRGGRS